ncbi:MAG: hypothetical protein ACRD88_09750 [Terriglobia bacterium]
MAVELTLVHHLDFGLYSGDVWIDDEVRRFCGGGEVGRQQDTGFE